MRSPDESPDRDTYFASLHTSAKQVKKSAFRCAVTDERRLMFIVVIVVWCEERVNLLILGHLLGVGGEIRICV